MATTSSHTSARVRECTQCPKYAAGTKDPLGHTSCSTHRACFQNEGWHPEGCNVCIHFRESLSSLSADEVNTNLEKLAKMLQRMQKCRRHWPYNETRTRFLSELMGGEMTGQATSPMSVAYTTSSLSEHTAHTPVNEESVAQVIQDTNSQSEQNPAFEVMSNAQIQQALIRQEGMINNLIATLQGRNDTRAQTQHTQPSQRSPSLYGEAPSVYEQSPTHTAQIQYMPTALTYHQPTHTSSNWSKMQHYDGTHMWMHTDNFDFQGHQVVADGHLRSFIRHPNQNYIRILEDSTDADTIFMSKARAFDILTSHLKVSKVHSDKMGPSNRCFRLNYDSTSGLAKAIRSLCESSKKALHALYTGTVDPLNLIKHFSSSFEIVSVVNFSSGWDLSGDSDFATWAKFKTLDLETTSLELKLDYTLSIPEKYLVAEKKTRSRFHECMTTIRMIEQKGKLSSHSENEKEFYMAMAEQHLTNLRDSFLFWLTKKYILRKIVLQFSQRPAAMRLLTSDIMEASLFSMSVIKSLEDSDTTRLGLQAILGLTREKCLELNSKPMLIEQGLARKPIAYPQKSTRDNFRNLRGSPRLPVPQRQYNDQPTQNKTSSQPRGGRAFPQKRQISRGRGRSAYPPKPSTSQGTSSNRK